MKTFEATYDKGLNISVKDRCMRKFIFSKMQQLQTGILRIADPLGEANFGTAQSSLSARIIVQDMQFYTLVFLRGSIGFAESFMHGFVEVDNITNLLLIFAKNLNLVKKSERSILSVFYKIVQSLFYTLSPNTVRNAKQRILAHYDLSNSLFELFLDNQLSYSALVFKDAHASLEEAAQQKITQLLDKLQLKSSDRLLEIGSGWGALAIAAAQHYNCSVTTTTISEKQYEYANSRISALQLQDKIKLLQQDYRQLSGLYNKLISVEMIEAVGYQYLPEYFKQCSNLLTDDGLFALQCITIKDDEYERAKNEVDFIKKYIFPGGCLPSMRKIVECLAEYTDLTILSCQDITYDYATTLNKWRSKFLHSQAAITKLGFDEYFMRMWEYYFSYCEAGFLNRNIMCLQLVLAKPAYKDPRQSC